MDPTEALNRIRHAIENYRNALARAAHDPAYQDTALAEADSIVEYMEALDGWMARGGHLPTPWATKLPACATLVGTKGAKLKSVQCPFCGGHDLCMDAYHHRAKYVSCSGCGAAGPYRGKGSDAVVMWEQRKGTR